MDFLWSDGVNTRTCIIWMIDNKNIVLLILYQPIH